MSDLHGADFFVYLPIADVKQELGAVKNKVIIEANFDEFEVTLRKVYDRTKVMIKKLDPKSDEMDAIVEIRSRFVGHLVDNDMIARVQAILNVNPEDQLMQDFMYDLRSGDPLTSGAEGLLFEREQNIQNLDPVLKAKLEEARAKRPNFTLLESFERQFLSGRELSERQVEILDSVLKPAVNPDHMRKITEALNLQPRSTFLKSLQQQLTSSGSLSPKQLSAVEAVLNQVVTVNQAHLDALTKALAVQPRSTFLKKLKVQVEAGSSLSAKQLEVVENMIGESSKPQFNILQDLLSNGSGLTPEDRDMIFRGVKDIDALSEDERKRVRHLLYRNTRRLHGTYTREFIQETLKKASMRLASLYMRNARR